MPTTTSPRTALFEENVLAFLLLLLGLLGVVVGLISPREHATELVLGVGFGGLGAWTLWREREALKEGVEPGDQRDSSGEERRSM